MFLLLRFNQIDQQATDCRSFEEIVWEEGGCTGGGVHGKEGDQGGGAQEEPQDCGGDHEHEAEARWGAGCEDKETILSGLCDARTHQAPWKGLKIFVNWS